MGQNELVGVLLSSYIEGLHPVAFGDDAFDEVIRVERWRRRGANPWGLVSSHTELIRPNPA